MTRQTPARPPTRRRTAARWLGAATVLLGLGVLLGTLAARWLQPTSGTQAAPHPGASAAAAAPSPAGITPVHAPALAARVPQRQVGELQQPPEGPATDWRLARWKDHPQVLVLEFPSLDAQAQAMNRIAALIEKAGAPRDRVLDDQALQRFITAQGDHARTFYLGHDYLAHDLARFFSLAQAQRLGLNAAERRLLALLQDTRVLQAEGSAWQALGLQALVTFTATQPDDPSTPQDETVDEVRRRAVISHELSHGLFFTDEAYREHCRNFWRHGLSRDERERFQRMLGAMGYDTGNENLLVNEMQAMLMHTADARAFSAASLGVDERQLQDMRRRFERGWPR